MDLRIGIIGYGLRASLVDHAHQPGAGSAVVAVCDPRRERLAAAAERYGADTVLATTLDELLAADLDAVFVLSPDHLHEEHALAALRAGVAVYLEKPLAITTEGGDRILAEAHASGAKLYVGHNMRHMPVIQTMRELVVAGEIGEVKAVWCRHFVGHGGDFYFKDWHAERSRSTGLLLQKGAHDIDVIHWLAGGYTRRVNAMGGLTVYGGISDRHDGSGYLDGHDWDRYERNWPPTAQTGLNPVIDVEDLSMVTMALDNGVFATYQQCHYTPDYWRNYTVIGTEGRLENFGDGTGARVEVWNRRHRGYAAQADRTVAVGEAQGGHGGADPRIVAEFLRFVRDGGRTLTSPVAAREAVATGCAATESLRSGGAPVDVPVLDADLVSYFDGGQRRG
ncbi:putative dehydrogenase [Streptoalloteichus tenebrarius]|uniref:Dehydrogenase n=1 Tax=Streptoalloteichus tenebrarius (strain ATCC 17920 / DSM 40477 / JCM 4838 / CBS 697.72 / NBRC 16177 / NCIMB 11028 / NRRL B-12390 / A12253. 1 / ISP 5477) TaxID=1933 RepID=A0ABT1HRW1_STRSD|nr:Gfo/Idh/MocA family oxidoreductase [Streptoalloteichus tenebrarius]MCP2258254.1 putative dehydrogenase [Streptoalloteichus tenebrarius]BFF04516.1 Gfo/Idh/MocA family oxidoreductase [Streptoalloteichus tenebrarius]